MIITSPPPTDSERVPRSNNNDVEALLRFRSVAGLALFFFDPVQKPAQTVF